MLIAIDLAMLDRWPRPSRLALLEPVLSNGAQSFSRFAFARFRFAPAIDCALHGERAGGGTPWALGGHPLTPLSRASPASYKTGAKNIYDQKIPKVQGVCYCFAC